MADYLFNYECLDSTNLEALRHIDLLKDNLSGKYWFCAAEQSGGRGQRNRIWSSPIGGIYISVLYSPPATLTLPQNRSLISLAAGKTVFRLLSEIFQNNSQSEFLSAPLKYHWSNDIYYNNCKIAGMLTETAAETAFVTGFGVNINSEINLSSGGGIRPVTVSQILNRQLELSPIITRLQKIWAEELNSAEKYLEGRFPDYISQFESHLAWLNAPVEVYNTEEAKVNSVSGILRGLTPAGFLRLETLDGETIVNSGSIRQGKTKEE